MYYDSKKLIPKLMYFKHKFKRFSAEYKKAFLLNDCKA